MGLVGANAWEKLRCYLSYLESSRRMREWSSGNEAPVLDIYPRDAPTGDETVLELASALSDELEKFIESFTRKPKPGKSGNDWKLRKSLQNSQDSISKPKQRKYWIGLAFQQEDFNKPAKTLSGGWIMGSICPTIGNGTRPSYA